MAGLGAFLETVKIYEEDNVSGHLWKYGKQIVNGFNEIAKEEGIEDFFSFDGYHCSPNYLTKNNELKSSLDYRTLFAQEMLNKGVMMPWVAFCQSHGDLELDMTLEAGRHALKVYKQALNNGIDKYLIGKAVKPVFRKFN